MGSRRNAGALSVWTDDRVTRFVEGGWTLDLGPGGVQIERVSESVR